MGKIEKEKQSKYSKKRIALIVLCIFLAVILLLTTFAGLYLNKLMSLIGRDYGTDQTTMSAEEYEKWLQSQKDTIGEDFTGEIINGSDVTWAENTEPIGQGKHIINILLIGQDRRAGEGRQRSDAMILCTINKDNKTVTLTSFMRDMYVKIPGYYGHRINASYELGGMKLLDTTLEKNFGVQVDGNVEVDFFGFIEVIDMLGGVDIELSSAEANYLNRNGNWGVDESTAGQWKLKAGMNHLTGEQALAYSRIRYVGNGDYERTERQRTVLQTLFEACKDLSVRELNALLQKLLPHLTTDMTNSEILGYTVDIFPMMSDLTMQTQRVPANGTFSDAYIDGMAVLKVDLEANKELLASCMEEPEVEETTTEETEG